MILELALLILFGIAVCAAIWVINELDLWKLLAIIAFLAALGVLPYIAIMGEVPSILRPA